MKFKVVKCANTFCGKEHKKTIKEINRNIQMNREMLCSLTCASRYKNSKEYHDFLVDHPSVKYEELIYFKNLLKRIKARCDPNSKNHRHNATMGDITLIDMIDIWIKQDRKCAYTGLLLNVGDKILKPSVDRIDSSKGYSMDNIQIVALPINRMKNNLSHEETKNLLLEIIKSIQKSPTPVVL